MKNIKRWGKFIPCHKYVNHAPIVKTLDIRLQYRVYLAEMEDYKFIPLSFREWYRYFISKS